MPTATLEGGRSRVTTAPRNGVYSAQMLRRAVADGLIRADRKVRDEQIQPASLDLRLGTEPTASAVVSYLAMLGCATGSGTSKSAPNLISAIRRVSFSTLASHT